MFLTFQVLIELSATAIRVEIVKLSGFVLVDSFYEPFAQSPSQWWRAYFDIENASSVFLLANIECISHLFWTLIDSNEINDAGRKRSTAWPSSKITRSTIKPNQL